MGLANHVVPQAELIDFCKAMAGRIMKNGPFAVALAKQAINTGMDTDLDSGLKLEANLFGLSFSTEDKKEGMTAFLEKRKEKHFTGKGDISNGLLLHNPPGPRKVHSNYPSCSGATPAEEQTFLRPMLY